MSRNSLAGEGGITSRVPSCAKAEGCDGHGPSRELGILHVAGLWCGWGNVVGGVAPGEAGSGHTQESGSSLQAAGTQWGASTKEGHAYGLEDKAMAHLQAGDPGGPTQAGWEHSEDGI